MARPPQGFCEMLPLPLPRSRTERTVLFTLRRMATHGVRDANAAWFMLDLFGARFRRPLVLLRAFMLEFAHAAQTQIRIASCRTPRMTADEGQILAILLHTAGDLGAAEDALTNLTRNAQVNEPLSAAAVFGRAIAELDPTFAWPETSAS